MREQNSNAEIFYLNPDWFKITEVGRNISAIREPNHTEDVVSYFIRGSKQNILIDSGMGLADLQAILSTPQPLLLLTHSHWDHMGGAHQFTQIGIYSDDTEKNRLQAGWNSSELSEFEQENFINEQFPYKLPYSEFSVKGVIQTEELLDGQRINMGDDVLQIIHTPGHTSGSVCYYLENARLLFTGDTLYPGPEYLHTDEADLDSYLNSLLKLFSITNGNLERIHPGHNSVASNPELLANHIRALLGEIEPLQVQIGEDSNGKYKKLMWSDFSLMLPQRA